MNDYRKLLCLSNSINLAVIMRFLERSVSG
jgi:hypothetical protein